MGKRRYFIAIVLRGQAFEQAEGVKAALSEKIGLRAALRSPAHITLHRPFEWKEEKEASLISKLAAFNFSGPLKLTLNSYDRFSERVIFIAVTPHEQLVMLHRQLKRFAAENLKLYNESQDERGFYPHVTVAFRDLKKKNFGQAWSIVQSLPIDQDTEVNEISLLRLDDRWREIETFGAKQ